MPLYEYQCKGCGKVETLNSTYPALPDLLALLECRLCGSGTFKRVWGFSYVRPMQAGYNPSVGKHISNMAQLKSEFSRMSDEAEMVTGNPHNFQPIDPMDKKALGVTDEGLASTHDHLISEGKTQEAKRLLKP